MAHRSIIGVQEFPQILVMRLVNISFTREQFTVVISFLMDEHCKGVVGGLAPHIDFANYE